MRTRAIPLVACAAVALLPARPAAEEPVRAEERPPEVRLSEPRLVPVPEARRAASRFHLALQVGYAAPWGDASAAEGDDLTRVLSFAVPVRLEATVALDRRDEAGVFLAYGHAGAGSHAPSCDGALDCSAHDLRAGVVARHVFAPDAPLAPSVAVAFGWESARLEVEWEGLDPSRPPPAAGRILHARRGIFGGIELAAERRLEDRLRAGPYLAVLAGQFGRARIVDAGATGRWEDVRGRALHGWIEIGVRASYGL